MAQGGKRLCGQCADVATVTHSTRLSTCYRYELNFSQNTFMSPCLLNVLRILLFLWSHLWSNLHQIVHKNAVSNLQRTYSTFITKLDLRMFSETFRLYRDSQTHRINAGVAQQRLLCYSRWPGMGLRRGQLKCDGTRTETRFRLWGKRTSPFKSVGASVQSTNGSRGVRISGSNAGYTMFRGSVKGTGYPLHSPVSPSLPLPCVTVSYHISTGIYHWSLKVSITNNSVAHIFTSFWALLFVFVFGATAPSGSGPPHSRGF